MNINRKVCINFLFSDTKKPLMAEAALCWVAFNGCVLAQHEILAKGCGRDESWWMTLIYRRWSGWGLEVRMSWDVNKFHEGECEMFLSGVIHLSTDQPKEMQLCVIMWCNAPMSLYPLIQMCWTAWPGLACRECSTTACWLCLTTRGSCTSEHGRLCSPWTPMTLANS